MTKETKKREKETSSTLSSLLYRIRSSMRVLVAVLVLGCASLTLATEDVVDLQDAQTTLLEIEDGNPPSLL